MSTHKLCFEFHLYYMTELTPWSRGLLDKLIITQMAKKFLTFYGTGRFVTVSTGDHHWTLFSAK